MDSTKLDELEKVAKAATPGPWKVDNCEDDLCPEFVYDEQGNGVCDTTGRDRPESEMLANAAYIAAASPDTILELIHKLRVAEKALEIAVADANGASLPTLSVEHYMAQAERELGGK